MSFGDFYSRQARRPSGLFGRFFMSLIFDKGNRVANDAMLRLVNPQGDDRIFELGFGSGKVVRRMADALTTGRVEGMDFSDAMLKAALKRNRGHVDSGRVRLALGDFDRSPCDSERFNKACSANTVYFWPDPAATAAGLRRILRPGGMLVLAFVGKDKMENMPLNMEVFTPYSPEEVHELLGGAGFTGMETHCPAAGIYCVKACKAEQASG